MPAVVVALVPILTATVRAIRQGWLPVGDNAYFLIRARDVFTDDHPLLGTWTSASLNTETNFNNPGPLFFDLMAIPVRLGGGTGLAIGVALLNAAMLVGVAVLARRQAGSGAGLVAVAAATLLCTSMGSQLMFDPWQPHSLLLAFLFCVTAVWAVSNGDIVAAPWALGVASLIVQTHLSYAVLIAALFLWGAVGGALAIRRAWASTRDRAGLRRRLRLVVATGVVVLLVCWSQPAIEQVTASGSGNLTRLARNATGSEETVGPSLGTRIVADTLLVPPFWFRPSFETNLRVGPAGSDGRTISSVNPSTSTAVALIGGLAAALLAFGLIARRRRDGPGATAVATAGVGLGAGLITAWQLPFGAFGIAPHQFRWMWPLGAFVVLAPVIVGLRWLRPEHPVGRGAAVAVATVTLVAAAVNLPAHNVRSGPTLDERAIEVMRRARPQMAALEGRGPILIDFEGIRFAEPFSAPVMAELQRRDIPFVFDDPVQVRQVGEGRRRDGPARRLVLRDGEKADIELRGGERVVNVEGLARPERVALAGLREELTAHITAEGLETTVPIETAVPASLAATVRRIPDADAVESLFTYRAVVSLVERDLIVFDDGWEDRFTRYAELQRRSDEGSLAIYVFPPEP